MKPIPMGFDLRWSKSDLTESIDAILSGELIKIGFDYVILPMADQTKQLAEKLQHAGKKAGIALDAKNLEQSDIPFSSFDYIELNGDMPDLIRAAKLVRSENPDCFLTVVTQTESIVPELEADAWRIDSPITDDFFELTRNVLDSCLGTGAADCNDYPSASRDRAKAASEDKMYCIPAVIPASPQFDAERVRAILSMIAMIRSPLFLAASPIEMTKEQTEILQNPVWRKILTNAGEAGGAIRYYDPWHGLFGRTADDGKKWLLILNRCHGDTPTDIKSEDLCKPEGTDFTLYDLYDGIQVHSEQGSFSIHVETSDHPETPCCRLYETTI